MIAWPRRVGAPLQASATRDEQAAILEWIRAHGIDPNLIPADGISIDPGEGWTRIEWLEYVVDANGAVVVRAGDPVTNGPHEKIVRGLPPFAVVDGAKTPPTRL